MQLQKNRLNETGLFNGLDELGCELKRIMNSDGSFWAAPYAVLTQGVRTWVPALDVSETENDFRVRLEVPGIKKEELQLSIHQDVLTVQGERKQESTESNENYHRQERVYGTFQRSIQLPKGVNGEAIKASYKDGVLEVILPKREEAKPRNITIQVE